jgi:putative nucleotidyltransferase with HDIG domain
MEIGISFFKSKISRRFFVLFLGCVFLPLTILVGFSYHRVENQLYEQGMLRLDKDCKVYGMALMDRLIHMNILVKIYVSYLSSGQSPLETSNDLRDQLTPMFDGLGCYQAGSGFKTFLGHIDLNPNIDLLNQLLRPKGQSALYIEKKDASNGSVYLIVPFTANDAQGLLIAQPKPSVLWGVGVNAMLPAMTELTVYDENRQIITTTQVVPNTTQPPLTSQSTSTNYLRFKYKIDGETYFASGWPLFLKSQFNAQTWTIVLSGTRANMLNAALEFKRTFPLMIIFTLWSILFLSLFFIRRTLTPLAILQRGTERIGNKDFNSRVEIHSGDEFEQLAVSFNTMTDQLNRQFNTLALIGEIARSILSSLDSSVIIPRSLRLISEFFSSQLIMLAQRTHGDPRRMRLTVLKESHRNDLDEEYVVLSSEEDGQLFTGAPFQILHDNISLPRFLTGKTTGGPLLFLPLDSERHAIGALILDLGISSSEESGEKIKQARQLADQLGLALSNAHLVSDLERLSLGAVEALARTVDAKSKWTAGHSERVANLAVKIAQAMNWGSDRIELLFRAGLLHDIGKIGIPIAILDKPGKLTDEEYNTIKNHPAIGGKILEPIQTYKDILPLIIQHHEHFNGKGYPYGLSGNDIDIGARILCVVDVYDALISQRPYREGWIKENVINFIREKRGTMFDPVVVDVFLALEV